MQLGRDGMGNLVPGMFAEPENPILRAANAAQAKTSLGQFADAWFPVPQNPLRGVSTLSSPMALVTPQANALNGSLRSLQCGPCAASSLKGLGQFDISTVVDSATSWLSDTTFGISNMWLLAGGALALLALTGGRGKGYREAVRSARKAHPTVAGRVRRAGRAAAAAY